MKSIFALIISASLALVFGASDTKEENKSTAPLKLKDEAETNNKSQKL